MPIYCYTNEEEGDTIEVLFTAGTAPQRICRNGHQYLRDLQAEHRPQRSIAGNWPMESCAMGVNPNQRREAEKDSVDRGVPTQFTRGGAAVFTSPKHRKQYCESLGYFDRNGGFSDPQRK